MDDSGKVTGTVKEGATASKAEPKLLDATNDSSVVINLEATSENSTNNRAIVGGAFGGSYVDDNGIIQTSQVVNPNQAEIIENASGRPTGTNVMHEVLESYIAGKNNPGTMGSSDTGDDAFNNAHSTANKLDPSHKESDYPVSFKTESIGNSRFGTVKMSIITQITTPVIKRNGQPHPTKRVATPTTTTLGTATNVLIR